MERRFPETVRSELARRGHPVNTVGDLDGPCSVEIIRRDAASGMCSPAPTRAATAGRWRGNGYSRRTADLLFRDRRDGAEQPVGLTGRDRP